MANTLLTTDMIADKALDILTQKVVFIPSINRSYDDSFAQTGGKIGDTLHVRIPQHGTIRKGRVMDPSPLVDVTTPIVIANQWGQDLNYSSAELALDIDEFAERYMDQRLADLAVALDSFALQTICTQVNSQTGDPTKGLADSFWPLAAGKLLDDQLAPMGDRTFLMNTSANVQIVKALEGLFNSQPDIAKQYQNGSMGKAIGFDWKTTTVMPSHTAGNFAGTPLINGAGQSGNSIVTDGWTASNAVLKAGDIIMFAGVNAVHAQTKQDLGYLQQFVVTADVTSAASGTTTVPVSPALQPSGPNQNVTASPADNAAITMVSAASATYGLNLAYTKDVGAFVTADLPIPPRKDAARRVYDNISLRVISDYDTINDAFLTRVDVLFGASLLRPQFGVRVANSLTLTPPT